jgi:hypothetical protein
LELVLAAQELFEYGECDLIYTNSNEDEKCWTDTRDNDIWKDVTCMKLLQEGTIPDTVDIEECKRTRKRILNYHWHDQSLYFECLFVPRLEHCMGLVIQMHKNLGHFREERTLAKICRRYFWHNKIKDVKTIVKMCQ